MLGEHFFDLVEVAEVLRNHKGGVTELILAVEAFIDRITTLLDLVTGPLGISLVAEIVI